MGWFSDHVLPIIEAAPLAGYIAAGVELAVGDKDGARRAAAASTGNLLSTAGAVGGFLVGGPPGAIAGGALANVLGGQVESAINGNGLDLSVKKVGIDLAIGGLTSIGGGIGGKVAGGVLCRESVQNIGKEVEKELVTGAGLKKSAGVVAGSTFGQASGQLVNDLLNKPRSEDKPRLITKKQALKAKQLFDFLICKVRDDFLEKWAGSLNETANTACIGDMTNNLAPVVGSIKEGKLYDPTYAYFQEEQERYRAKKADGRVQRAQDSLNSNHHTYVIGIFNAVLEKIDVMLLELNVALLEEE